MYFASLLLIFTSEGKLYSCRKERITQAWCAWYGHDSMAPATCGVSVSRLTAVPAFNYVSGNCFKTPDGKPYLGAVRSLVPL